MFPVSKEAHITNATRGNAGEKKHCPWRSKLVFLLSISGSTRVQPESGIGRSVRYPVRAQPVGRTRAFRLTRARRSALVALSRHNNFWSNGAMYTDVKFCM